MYSTQKNITDQIPSIISDAVCNRYLQYPDGTGKRKAEGGLRLEGKYKQSLQDKPLITVITVVYNNEETLERCIKSVLDQTYDNIEYIVIDGGSTDGTLDIINKYKESIDYFISEPDGGIYYAMNKAIALASGDYLNFMNSDDWFTKQESILDIIPDTTRAAENIIYGKIMYYKDDTMLHENNPKAIDDNILAGHPIPHQAAFIPQKSFNLLGDYDTKFSLAADYDWWVRAKLQDIEFTNTNNLIANFSSGGANHQSFILGQVEAIISLYKNKVESINKPLKTNKFTNTLKETDRVELETVLNKINHNYNIETLLKNLIPPKISIIIPVYNVSKYLRKCLDSTLNQTLQDIEIIIVNDCSPDPIDDEICKEYADKDDRIIYIKHTENKRQGGARNTALNVARGKYLWFVDADDFIDINACEFLYNTAKSANVDVLAFSANTYYTKDENAIFDLSGDYNTYERDKSLYSQKLKGENFLKRYSNILSPCLYLFNLNLFKKFRFREGVCHEDTDLIPILLFNAKSVCTVKYAPYFRFIRENSVTQVKWTESRVLDYFASVESLLKYIYSNNLACESSLAKDTRVRYNNSIKNLPRKIDIESDKINKQIDYLKILYDKIFLETEQFSINTHKPPKVDVLLNDRWYRFGQMSRKGKLWTVAKIISKKTKTYGLLKPILKRINYEKK